jgi:hypothetical protein
MEGPELTPLRNGAGNGPLPGRVRLLVHRALRTALALAVAAALWLPCLHLVFARRHDAAFAPEGVPAAAQALVARHLEAWSQGDEVGRMHATSDEWDFMGRTFVAWSLANMALRDSAHQQEYLSVIDRIVADTQRLERERGFRYFLLPYGKTRAFVATPERSLFVDGEIALMLGLRRLVADDDQARSELSGRVAVIAERMGTGPVVSAESYPNECWTFCNAVALAALRVADALDGTDHRDLAARWVTTAKNRLVDKQTGLLVSRYSYDGRVMEGPEGSSLWMAAHALEIVDEPFARDQYARAKAELGRSLLGFGYAAEWPKGARGAADIDSGPIVPLLDASAGSSGLALVAAKGYGDRAYFGELMTTLEFAAFPVRSGDTLRYAAGNQAGDAVVLYATVLGPAWAKVKELLKR